MKIGIFFGSTTGNTEEAANRIEAELGELCAGKHDVGSCSLDDFLSYDVLILGVPTWNIGEMQDDWAGMLGQIQDLEDFDMSSKTVALFGLGDQREYPDTFIDAMGELWETFEAKGAKLVGHWPIEGYDFTESKALASETHFLGLALDEDQEADLSEDRIKEWVAQIKSELAIEV